MAGGPGLPDFSSFSDYSSLWPVYFPGCLFSVHDPRLPVIEQLREFFLLQGPLVLHQLSVNSSRPRLYLDYRWFSSRCPVQDFPSEFAGAPGPILAALGLAAHEAARQLERKNEEKDCDSGLAALGPEAPFPVRFLNFSPLTPLRHLKAASLGKFVAVRGTVVKTSAIKPLVKQMKFQCAKCGAQEVCRFNEGFYSPPTKCSGACGARQGKWAPQGRFQAIPDRTSCVSVDFQVVRLQEILGLSNSSQGDEEARIPRTIDCELTEDLVDCCVPGEILTITGIVKQARVDQSYRGRKSTLFEIYIDANAVEKNGKAADGARDLQNKLKLTEFGQKDFEAIARIHAQHNLFQFLVHSLCPPIFGHELVKAGLLLALFGGSSKKGPSKKDSGDSTSALSVRQSPHLLIVGDPGLGKSQMLRAVAALSPRGVYIASNTSTKSGLTVTMVRDGRDGDFSLEAGALVLGDLGVTCIDEFDKLGADQSALLESMEQQTISIAKAGIVCSLAARTSVIAAANPSGGHYNRAKSIGENLKIPAPLLSRFDLIFIMLDKPDHEKDHLLSEHILAIHGGKKSASEAAHIATSQANEEFLQDKLSQRLKMRRDLMETFDPLPVYLMQKYIAYAKRFVQPALSEGAKEILEEFYFALRKKKFTSDGTPITTRQLEALIRLAEARARSELRNIVTPEDARDVVDLMQESVEDLETEGGALVDYREKRGPVSSKAKAVQALLRALTRRGESRGSTVFTRSELSAVAKEIQIGLEGAALGELVDKMNEHGYLIQKPGGFQVAQFSD